MKVRKLLLSALCLIGATAVSISASSCQEDPTTHEHKFSEEWSYSEENLDLGHWHKCGDDDCVQVSDTAAHTWDNGTVTKTATCFAEGEITYKCTVCEATRTQTVEKLSHSYSAEWSKDGAGHWHACTADGCDDKKGYALHSWDGGKTTKPATCIEDGTTTYTCTECKQTKTEPIDTVNHTYSTEWSSDGTNHWHECTTAGCDIKADVLSHSWNNGVVTKAATCFEEGVTTYTCTECGQTKTQAINKVNHTFSTEWSSDGTNHWHECTVNGCDAKDTPASHTFGDWTNDSRFCSECGFAEAREHVHVYAAKWSSDGTNHWHECTTAGCNDKDEVIPHAWNNGEITKEATCYEEGVTTYTCTECGHTKTQVINKVEHTFSAEWSKDGTNHWHECTVNGCNGKDIPVPHSFGEWQEGWEEDTRACTDCNHTETRVHEHSYSTEWSSDGSAHWHACEENGCPATTEHIPHEKLWHNDGTQHWFNCETCEYVSEKDDHNYNADKLCECDKVTDGLTYTIKNGEAELTAIVYQKVVDDQTVTICPSDPDLTVIVIASHVKDVDGVAVPCSAGDEGAVPVTSIGKSAFSKNSFSVQLTEVYVPATVTKIGDSAFGGCKNLVSLRTNAKFKTIGASAFYDSKGGASPNFTGVDLSETTSIGATAFSGTKITTANLSGATNIGKSAFSACASLESVILPDSMTKLPASVFAACTKLESIDLSGITIIDDNALKGCSKLSSVNNAEGVTRIGNSAFEGCPLLTSFDLTNVTSVGTNAFKGTGITHFKINKSLTYYATSFTGAETLTFEEGVTALKPAFSNLTTLKTVYLPASLTSVVKDMFKGCKALNSINYAKTIEDFKAITKGDNWDGGLEYTVKCSDGSITSEELNAAVYTQITQAGTYSGTTVGASESIADFEVVYYLYTATTAGNLKITADNTNGDLLILISKESFEDIKKNSFNLPDYLGDLDGYGNFVTECTLSVSQGDNIYIAVLFGEYSFSLEMTD